MILRAVSMLALLLLAACQNASSGRTENEALLVFAAASLTDAFQEAGSAFAETHPQSQINFNFGGSQQLAQQIIAGAPGDVFASADLTQMQVAIQGDRIPAAEVQILAANQLVVVYPRENSAHIGTIEDLVQPGLRLVLPAQEVPAGRYAMHFLNNAAQQLGPAYGDRVLANVVSYELNVRAVLTKVMLGEADAGIVYNSDVNALPATDIAWLPIPAELNVQAIYYIAPIVDEDGIPLASDFITYILSQDGQDILQRYGFTPLAAADLD